MPTVKTPDMIGIVPAGGWARRLAALPCSKEIYPIGFSGREAQEQRPKVVCEHVLEGMKAAGIRTVYLALRPGKWDIPAYLGNGAWLGMHLAYLMVASPDGPAYSVDEAFPFVQGALVAMGFPDCLFEPNDAFLRLRERQAATGADLVLGLFPLHPTQTVNLVEVDADGRVHAVLLAPAQTARRLTWIMAVWTPAVTHFFHAAVASDAAKRGDGAARGELFVGDVFQAAIDAGLHVNSVVFEEGTYLDIGTPENLLQAVRTGVAHR